MVFFKYLRQCRRCILGMVLCLGIYGAIFAMYKEPWAVIWYPAVLCVLVGVILFVAGFWAYYRRHKELLHVRDNIELLWKKLPAPLNPEEEDYQSLLKSLGSRRDEEYCRWQSKQAEMADYYATWVHQIKAPIAVMRVILQSEDTPSNQELLSELFRVEQYVEMVLYYVRLDEGASDLVIEECSLDKIIRQAIRKYAGQFIRGRIRLVYEGTGRTVLTDEKWLGFMLEQLLSNAVKYTEKGMVTISVDDSDHLIVEDTGIGIAPEDMPRIFEKGFTDIMAVPRKSPPVLACICAKAPQRNWGIKFLSPRFWDRGHGLLLILAIMILKGNRRSFAHCLAL